VIDLTEATAAIAKGANGLDEWRSMKGGTPFEQLRAIARKEKEKILRNNGTLPKLKNPGKKKVTFDLPVKSAVAAVLTAMAALPTTSAQELAPPGSTVFDDEGVLFWQLIGALAIWAIYRLSRAMLITDRKWRRIVNFQLLLLTSAWVRQMFGAQLSIVQIWRLVIATGYAPAAFMGMWLFIALFAWVWIRAENNLHQHLLKS
jgi:hypothetical protein